MKRIVVWRVIMAIVGVLAAQTALEAEPYAPVVETSNADATKNYFARKLSRPTIPEQSDVPVPVYPGARILEIGKLTAVEDERFQWRHKINLVTDDAVDTVVAHYQKTLTGWTHHALRRSHKFVESDGELWVSSKKLLHHPQVMVTAIDRWRFGKDHLLELAPATGAVITVTYPGEVLPVLEGSLVAVRAAFDKCVERNMERNKPNLKAYRDDVASLRKAMEQSCQSIHKACTKDVKSARCQRALYTYR